MGKLEIARSAAIDPPSEAKTANISTRLFQHKPATSLPLPGRRLEAMALQSGSAMQSSQSSPQQFVRLIGHRHASPVEGVRPRPKNPQMGSLELEAPIG